MYNVLACTILPPISPTIYFHANPVPGVTLEQVTEVFLRFGASQWLLHGLLYVIAEDHPNIRLESLLSSDRNTPGTESPASTQDRTDLAVLLHSTALPFLDYFHRHGAL